MGNSATRPSVEHHTIDSPEKLDLWLEREGTRFANSDVRFSRLRRLEACAQATWTFTGTVIVSSFLVFTGVYGWLFHRSWTYNHDDDSIVIEITFLALLVASMVLHAASTEKAGGFQVALHRLMHLLALVFIVPSLSVIKMAIVRFDPTTCLLLLGTLELSAFGYMREEKLKMSRGNEESLTREDAWELLSTLGTYNAAVVVSVGLYFAYHFGTKSLVDALGTRTPDLLVVLLVSILLAELALVFYRYGPHAEIRALRREHGEVVPLLHYVIHVSSSSSQKENDNKAALLRRIKLIVGNGARPLDLSRKTTKSGLTPLELLARRFANLGDGGEGNAELFDYLIPPAASSSTSRQSGSFQKCVCM